MAYTNLLGQVRVGVRGAQVVSQSLLLDGMTGIMGAYSLRKLIGTWTGDAILVRRSLDNTESGIGFDAGGDLDQSALISFVRPTITGYVLDQYSGSVVGLSLRKISGSYSGSAIRVRRSGDNAEQNIGFDVNGGLDTSSLLSFVNSSDTSTSKLLDQYSGASAAYSLRKLRNAYSGSAIRVRRSSDNSELNIGFDASGNLDTVSLLSFVGAGDGFVSIWYDQSGNGKNATQPSSANQPQIVVSGTLQTLNSKPTLYFDGSSRYFDCGYLNGGTKPADYSTFALARYTWSSYQISALIHSQNSVGSGESGYNMMTMWSGGRMVGNSSNNINYRYWYSNSLITLNQRYLFEGHYKSNTSPYVGKFYFNNNSIPVTDWLGGTAQNNSSTEFKTSIGRGGEHNGNYFKGEMQELVTYFSDQTTNRSGISSNINSYYSIYTPTENAFVTTWYDQTGLGRHATQSVVASQPQIVSAGSVITQGGKPTIKFDGIDDYLKIITFTSSVKTIFALFQHNGVDNYDGIVTARTTGQVNLGLASDERSGFTMANSQTTIDSIDATSFYVNSFQTKTLESTYGLNYVVCIKSNSLSGVKNFIIGADIYSNSRWLNGSVNEIIMYSNDLTSDRNNFVGNINTYYNWSIFTNNGYVKTWYDQSGLGRHATQTTASSQPKIFSGHSVIRQGIKPTISYDGVDDYLVVPTFNDKVQSIFALFNKNTTNFITYNGILTAREINSTLVPNSNERVGFTGVSGANAITGFSNTTSVWINARSRNVSNYNAYNTGQALPYRLDLNLVSQFATASLVGSKNIVFGFDVFGQSRYLNGTIPEIMIYSSNQLSNKDTIESNINSYYSVYPNIVQTGLVLNLDANDFTSYPQSGSTWTDISGSGNNGTMVNGPVFGTASGGQITFDGVNDYASFPTMNTGNIFSVQVWAKISRFGGGPSWNRGTLVANSYNWGGNTGFFFFVTSQNPNGYAPTVGMETFSISIGQDVTGANAPAGSLKDYVNKWVNLSAVVNGTNPIKLYLNGYEISTYGGQGNGPSSINYTSALLIGSRIQENCDFTQGSIGGVYIYNRALAASEILQNYNATKSRFGL